MAVVNLQETDTAATCGCGLGGYCSGLLQGQFCSANIAQSGGVAGSVENSVDLNQNVSTQFIYIFDCVIPAGALWNAGTWTVRLDVTTGNMFMTLQEIWLCRVNSACASQATIGSLTAIGQSMATPGVFTFNVTGVAQVPVAGDRVTIVFGFSSSSMNQQILGVTPSQVINTPFTVATTDREQTKYVRVAGGFF